MMESLELKDLHLSLKELRALHFSHVKEVLITMNTCQMMNYCSLSKKAKI